MTAYCACEEHGLECSKPCSSHAWTEYWKSNARKFCDFCKCWLADNKISISFHENGKRHKENVQKHIADLTKKSAKDFKQQVKVDDEMKKMEEAAMAAYMQDVKNNADLTSQNINKILDSKECSSGPVISKETVKPTLAWVEVKADDGHIYYWNNETNETTWNSPEEYVSLKEQEEQKKKDQEKKKAEERLKKQKQAEAVEEMKAFAKREKLKERAAKKSDVQSERAASEGPVCGPAPRANAYGGWAPVPEKSEEDSIDLQLPNVDKTFVEAPVVVEPEVIRFKERKVDSLGEGNVDFKKRKLNSGAKRNIRQKVDDE